MTTTSQCLKLSLSLSASLATLLAIVISPALAAASQFTSDTFHESLHLRPLPSGRVQSIFNFTLNSATSTFDTTRSNNGHIFQLLPASLINLLESQSITLEELHISFNKGRWDYQTWGRPVISTGGRHIWGSEMVGTGAEVWARYAGDRSLDLEYKRQEDVFYSLLDNLSGQFCSSLAAPGSRESISSPSSLTKPLYRSRQASNDNKDDFVMHLNQPPSPCTETLYPMLALLPCKNAVGLASLLEPHHWLSSEWHGIELVARRHAGQSGWTIHVIASSVFDPVRETGKSDFSITQVFGKSLTSTCPLAESSFIRLMSPPQDHIDNGIQIQPAPAQVTADFLQKTDEDEADEQNGDDEGKEQLVQNLLRSQLNADGFLEYDTSEQSEFNEGHPLDISLRWPNEASYKYSHTSGPQSDLRIERSYISTSLLDGHIVLRMANTRPDISRRLIYREVLPWFVDLDLPSANSTTVPISVPDSDLRGDSPYIEFTSDLTSSPVLQFHYTPSIPRSSPSMIEVDFRIPPNVQVEWKVSFDKETIRYEEHPPDAHRGLEIGVGTVWELSDYNDDDDLDISRNSILSMTKLTPSLIEVTVPDFSMPYNVIIFTCTLLALFAGSTLNILTRKYKDVNVPVHGEGKKDDDTEAIKKALLVWNSMQTRK
ncbi:unnamed protein product [Sympodiomycopsis kandeliae]